MFSPRYKVDLDCEQKQEAQQLVGRQNASALDFDPNPSEAAFSAVFFSTFFSTVVSDVISGIVDQDVGMDICANFVNSGD